MPFSVYSAPLSVLLYNADGSFREPIFLVTIDLPAFGGNPARTLRLSTPEFVGPDGTPWDNVLGEVGQVGADGAWLTARWNPADLDLVILDRRVTDQAANETFSDLLAAYDFVSAPVHVQVAFENTLSTADYATIFRGRIVEWRDLTASRVTLYCEQDRTWSKIIPPNVIDTATYPYAPKDVIGARRPILIGDFETGLDTIPTVASGYEAAQAGVARGAVPVVIVEQESAGGGLTTPKVLVSDLGLVSDPVRLMMYERALDTMAYSFSAPVITGTGPTYAKLDSYQFFAACLAIENDSGTTTATNWQELLRTDKPVTLDGYCTLDYDASARVLNLLLPDVQELGTFVGAQVFIWYNKTATGATRPRFGAKNSATVDALQDFADGATSPTSSATPHGFAAINVGPAGTGGTDTVTTWEDIKSTSLYADVRAAGQVVQVHRLALLLLYKPKANVVRPGTSRNAKLDSSGPVLRRRFPVRGTVLPLTEILTSPDVASFDAPLWAYAQGVPDSSHGSGAANGTYTGTAGALIEHPVDVAHWALRELGGLGAGDVTTASGDFGSFTDARTALSGYKMRALLSEQQDVESFIEDLGKDYLFWVHRRTTDASAPFVCIPWTDGASADYRSASDLVTFNREGAFVLRDSLRVSRTPTSAVANSIRVNFDYDLRTRTFAGNVFVNDTDSRVYSGGSYTTDATREGYAADSVARHGRREVVVNLRTCGDAATATSVLTRLFDWRVEPRIVVRFLSFLNAIDLERGHVIELGSDWDTFLPYPKAGAGGSWSGKALRVFSVVKQSTLPIQYAITAIET